MLRIHFGSAIFFLMRLLWHWVRKVLLSLIIPILFWAIKADWT